MLSSSSSGARWSIVSIVSFFSLLRISECERKCENTRRRSGELLWYTIRKVRERRVDNNSSNKKRTTRNKVSNEKEIGREGKKNLYKRKTRMTMRNRDESKSAEQVAGIASDTGQDRQKGTKQKDNKKGDKR